MINFALLSLLSLCCQAKRYKRETRESGAQVELLPADFPIFDSFNQKCSPTNDTLDHSMFGCGAGYTCRNSNEHEPKNFICKLGDDLAHSTGKSCSGIESSCPTGSYCANKNSQLEDPTCLLCGTESVTCGKSRSDSGDSSYSYSDCCPGFTCTNITAVAASKVGNTYKSGYTFMFVCLSDASLKKRQSGIADPNGCFSDCSLGKR